MATPVRSRLATFSTSRQLGVLRLTWDRALVAGDNLRANKLRTALTILGVVIGVWSVVSLLAIGNGVQRSVSDQVRNIGTNLLAVLPGTRPTTNPRQYAGVAPLLTMDDVQAIERAIPEVAWIAPEYQREAPMVVEAIQRSVRVIGVTPAYAIVRNVTVAEGDFITDNEQRSMRPVVVLGSQVAERLFGAVDPLDQPVRIKGQAFRIVGVLEPAGSFGGYDDAVLIPLTVAQRSLFGARDETSGSGQLTAIALQVTDAEDLELVMADIERVFRRRHRLPEDGSGDDFTVFNQAALMATFTSVTTTLTILLGVIAGISLLVGGIGVMNIMLVSVTERMREIGLRRAVGAKRMDIFQQFMIEAATISLLGGLIGIMCGWATVVVAEFLASEYLVPVITPGTVLLAIGVSCGVGFSFGVLPARRAARLTPSEALRVV